MKQVVLFNMKHIFQRLTSITIKNFECKCIIQHKKFLLSTDSPYFARLILYLILHLNVLFHILILPALLYKHFLFYVILIFKIFKNFCLILCCVSYFNVLLSVSLSLLVHIFFPFHSSSYHTSLISFHQ